MVPIAMKEVSHMILPDRALGYLLDSVVPLSYLQVCVYLFTVLCRFVTTLVLNSLYRSGLIRAHILYLLWFGSCK